MTAHSKTSRSAQAADLDPGSLDAVRNALADEGTNAPRAAAPEGHPSGARAAPEKAVRTAMEADKRAAQEEMSFAESVMAKIKGYRPTPRHILLGGLALLILFRPWLVFALVLLSLFVLIGVFLTVGYDEFWRKLMAVARWRARHDPAAIARVNRRLDAFAVKFDAFLDRFPEGTVDGLYLPDLSDSTETDARHTEAVERRLDELRETKV